MLGTNFKKAIAAINAKSRLLSLPPDLRLRIFEYVFGTVRHHVKIKEGGDKKWHVYIAPCKIELEPGHHTYRKKTLEETTLQSDELGPRPDHRRHLNCHREWNNRRLSTKGHKRRLPQSLLLTCKTINEDAALIMWHNHIFELELFTDDLEKYVNRMTPSQRTALRTIAFDVLATDMGQTMTRRSRATPPDALSLLTWRQPMRDSFLALTRLQRVELYVDIWPGIEAVAPYAFETLSNGDRKKTKCNMISDWIRLLERRDLEDVDVRVEEGALMQPHTGLHPRRNPPFAISTQQRAEWEEQIRMIVRGRSLELVAGQTSAGSAAGSSSELGIGCLLLRLRSETSVPQADAAFLIRRELYGSIS